MSGTASGTTGGANFGVNQYVYGLALATVAGSGFVQTIGAGGTGSGTIVNNGGGETVSGGASIAACCDLRIGAAEIEGQMVVALGHRNHDLVKPALVLFGLVLMSDSLPGAIGQALQLGP